MTTQESIRLDFSVGRPAISDLAEINRVMRAIGSGVWPLDLSNVPVDIKKLLCQPSLTTAEADQVKRHFLLPRQRLVQIIQRAGREPNVPGGGELTTCVSNHGYSYPQLYVVEEGIDYSRFDRFHVNTADDGTAVDEIAQFLSGRGLVFHHRLHNELAVKLHVSCPNENAGWLIAYNGDNPHIGSVSEAATGTKILVQVIGPARWVMRYEEDASEEHSSPIATTIT